MMREIEGYSAENPVPDEDWFDGIGWELLDYWRERKGHDQAGWFAREAGSPQCLALGHKPDPEHGWDDDDLNHPYSWDGDPLCIATKYDTCCTQCQGECDRPERGPSPTEFWRLFGASA